ncbi:MAG: hypothetical protein KGS72_12505, partial [Cyanobacteria bacterium REEB67]|nr:hypothetical protein [Cyanobacteria bacterium REEB67]
RRNQTDCNEGAEKAQYSKQQFITQTHDFTPWMLIVRASVISRTVRNSRRWQNRYGMSWSGLEVVLNCSRRERKRLEYFSS